MQADEYGIEQQVSVLRPGKRATTISLLCHNNVTIYHSYRDWWILLYFFKIIL